VSRSSLERPEAAVPQHVIMGPEAFKLEWISSFVAVVDSEGFAAAARDTFKSQSRISTHVAELERRLGTMLFDRRERPVRLTPTGTAFLAHARAVLQHLEEGANEIGVLLGRPSGDTKLACYPSVGATFVPSIIGLFQRRYPQARVSLREAATLELDQLLDSGHADLALRPAFPSPPPGLASHHLWDEPLVAVIPDGHALTDHPELTLSQLADCPLITVGTGSLDCPEDYETSESFRLEDLNAQFVFRTNQPQTLIGLVREGLGIGFTNLLSASTSDTAGVVIRPVIDTPYVRSVGVYWDPRRPMSVASAALLETIRSVPVPTAVSA